MPYKPQQIFLLDEWQKAPIVHLELFCMHKFRANAKHVLNI